jgi:pyruvate kinase
MGYRHTKIVATIGPATSDPATMRALVAAGVDVVRLNAAHADAETHRRAAAQARSIAADLGRPIGVLVDLPGPKLRTGPVVGDEVELRADQPFVLTAAPVVGDGGRVSTSVGGLAEWVRPGDEVFLADGAIVLAVERVDGDDVVTTVVRGGWLRSRKGMHLPRAEEFIASFTEADAAALDLAVEIKADFVGLSFVRAPEDVERVAEMLPRRGPRPGLVPKIETASALDHLPGIVAPADAVMVARGDLGIQVAARRVPLLQKEIIRFCNLAGRPVITATQMLESMTHAPLATRAEVNDVANAVIDGTDALMLSEETAVGDHAVDAVRTMAETAEAAESWPRIRPEPAGEARSSDRVAWAVAHAAIAAAEDLGVAAIVCPTRSGATARNLAAFRPRMPIVALSARPAVLGALTLAWGVHPVLVDGSGSGDVEIGEAVSAARGTGLVGPNDLVAVVAGSPGPRAGSTDYVRIVRA